MPSPQTCESTHECVRGTDQCRRYKGHRGKHRGQYAQWAQTPQERAASAPRRYVPPHCRTGADSAPYGPPRRYRRPGVPGGATLNDDTGVLARGES